MKFSLVMTAFGLFGAAVSQGVPPPPPPPPPASSLATSSGAPGPIIPTGPPPPPRSMPTSLPSVTDRRSRGPRPSGEPTASARGPRITPASVVPANGTITTTVDAFVTICVTTQTFTVNGICYTATTPYQTITVTNCGCTVVGTSPATAGLITGAIATPTAKAVGGTATEYAAASATKYVTAAGANVSVVMSLLAVFMSMPLFAAFML